MEQPTEDICNSLGKNAPNKDEDITDCKENSAKCEIKDTDPSLSDILLGKPQTANVQNDCNVKNITEHSDYIIDDHSKLNDNSSFTMQEDEIHTIVNKLMEFLIENIDGTKLLAADAPSISHNSNSNVDQIKEKCYVEVIDEKELVHKNENGDKSSVNNQPSDELQDEVIVVSPDDSSKNCDSPIDIEILEEIIKQPKSSLQNQENISCSNDNLLKNDTVNEKNTKPQESSEPLNISLLDSKQKVSESHLKSILGEKNNINESLSCSSQENNSGEPLINVQKIKPFEKVSDEETGFPKFLEDLVTIGNYAPVMGDFTLKGNEALIDCPSIVTPFLVKQPDKFPPSESKVLPINQNFFDTSVGEFLCSIGFSRVTEWFHRDMAKINSQRIKSSGKTDELAQKLKAHQTFYFQAKKANEPFVFPSKTCKICNYSTESSLVLEGHMLVPHFTAKREFQCNFCTYFHRDARTILEHLKLVHGKIGYVDHIFSGYECPCCIFETNSRPKLQTHISRCTKYFNHSKNQAPIKDFEFPCLTPKPITVSIVKSYEQSLSGSTRGRPSKPIERPQEYYQPQMYPFCNQSSNYKSSQLKNVLSDALLNQMYTNVNSYNSGVPVAQRNSNHLFQNTNSVTNTQQAQYSVLPQKNKAIKTMHHNTYDNSSLRRPDEYSKILPKVPSSTTQLPRLQGPFSAPMTQNKFPSNISPSSHSLVVCEICDGYIKDLEQLRMHMQLIHKVKINPKMLSSRPPLNCQKCFWRFFTDHGLERHLLGSHGLVTSNMQELADKNKDAGCCTICGKVYASKLVAHMNQEHKIALKPANLSYKCTVCSATFGLYRLFENHVYLVHAGGTKRPSSENDPVSRKSLKLNGPC